MGVIRDLPAKLGPISSLSFQLEVDAMTSQSWHSLALAGCAKWRVGVTITEWNLNLNRHILFVPTNHTLQPRRPDDSEAQSNLSIIYLDNYPTFPINY